MNWDDYRYFLAVARSGTLKRAAADLKVDQATVGRKIGALQEELGAQLLEKRSDGYFLTTIGQRILANVETAEQAMLTIDRSIAGTEEKAEGPVKLAMPGALANQWLVRELAPFFKSHPKIELQLLTGGQVLNLARREADVAIRLVRPSQKELKTKKIGSLKLALYGAKKFGDLKAADYESAPFIGLYDSSMSDLERKFLTSLGFDPQYRIRSAAWSSVFVGIETGLGIGVLPKFIGDRNPSLKILEEDRAEAPLWLVVHPEVSESARIRAVIQFVSQILS